MPALQYTQHFLDAVIPDLVTSGLHGTDTVLHRHAVPGFTDTKAIDDTPRQTVHHLLRRQYDDAHIALRIYPASL